MSWADGFAVKLAQQVIRLRWLVVVLTILLVGAAGYGGQFLGFSTDYRIFFSDENPQLQAFDELQNVYTKTDNIVFVLKPKEGDVFQPRVFQAIQEMTEGSWQLPFSSRVDSLSNYQHTYAEGDDLTVVDLIYGDPTAFTQKEMEAVREVALNEPLLLQRLISEDGKTTGINITFQFPQKTAFETPTTVKKVRELLAEMQAKYPEIEIRPSGVVMMNNAFSESSQNDLGTLIPLMYALLLLSMLLFLRSFYSTLATLFVIAFSAITAMGLAGYAGIQLTPPSSTAPTVILTLAIADSIHIIVSMLKMMQRGMAKREAIIESIRINLQPVFLTSITTAIGFLSLNFSDAPPFHDLGNITATGVIAAFLYSVIFLPALLAIFPVSAKVKPAEEHNGTMEKLGDFVVSYRKILLPVSTLIVVLLTIQIPKIELNDEFVKYFDYSIPFRADTEFMMDNLTGIYQIEYSLGAASADGVNDREYMQNLEKFSDWLRAQPEVVNVYSMIDIYKRLNKNMHGDDPDWYRIPDEKEMAAQYLLLYEFSLPYGLDLNDRINVDKSATRLTATLVDMSTLEMREFRTRAETWLKNSAPDYMYTRGTSPIVMFAYISERNINSMVVGNTVALFLISFCIMVALASIKIGLFSLIPNLIPPLMGFGIWAVLVGQVNMAGAITAAVSLGIIVDDTVHMLSKYFRARREKGYSPEDAVRYAFSTVGTALVVTTFILIIGFSVLAFSGFAINSILGVMTAIMIACALIADFFLLPPLLIMLDKDKKPKEQTNHA